jgi:signal transduction histidine kinase
LQRIQQSLDELLRQYSNQLANSIETERSSFRRKIHDGLLQDVSTAYLQVSTMLMRNAGDGKAQFSVTDFADVEASLHRVIDDARALMQDG